MALGGRDQTDWTFPVLLAICAAFAATAAGTVLAPLWFWLPLAVLAVCAVTILAYRYTAIFCVIWLLVAGFSADGTKQDIFFGIGSLIGCAALIFYGRYFLKKLKNVSYL